MVVTVWYIDIKIPGKAYAFPGFASIAYKKQKNLKNFKKGIAKPKEIVYTSSSSQEIALSPNGKATDSDSVISRFESL